MTAKVKLTVRERLHKLVDKIDDQRAEAMLVLLGEGAPIEQPSVVKGPTSADDPLWNITAMVGDEYDGPTDVSANKYRYIAEHPEVKSD